ncbi:MAG: sigma-70 family RNA polymerase sigma factor [Nitrospirae bacterium]|nr:sigma-70 family RNA polymerase sigma factor [Nitrospirota bacterium]MBI3393648.1 sigma-70 family RNA polymerase sigma factor [Nitrospirota bacterium]
MTNPSASPSRSERFEAEALVHLGPLYRTALRLTGNDADAQDLVQEAVLRAFRFFDSFEPGTNCRAWLFRILMNTFVNEYRKRVRGPHQVDLDETTMSTLESRADQAIVSLPATPEEVVFAGMLDGDLKEGLWALPAEFRAAVLLCDVEEFSYKEIAEMTQVPVGTVMSRIHRGRRALREFLLRRAKPVRALSAGA